MLFKGEMRGRILRAVMATGLSVAAGVIALQVTPPVLAAGSPFKGVANAACGDLSTLKTSWWYNWYINPGGCNAKEFVPMASGKDKHGSGDIKWQADQAYNAGYRTLLGFNEPDHADQANMSVDLAVSLWPTLTARSDVRIGGPAPSSDSSGRAWFNSFMTHVKDNNQDTRPGRTLRVDFLTMHWYGWNAGSCDANAANLESQIKWMEGFSGNRPIWVTEFGCLNASKPNMATVNAFYQGALKVFARHPRVQRYAWYPWIQNNELISGGNKTQLGNTFANAPATR